MIPALRPLQAKAVEWAVEHRGGMLCDGTGSGKTRVILEALDQLGARKVIVATTASMSGAWRDEAHRWLPDWTVAVVEGRKAPFDQTARLTVVGHDNCFPRLDELHGLGADAVVMDESHHARSYPLARRTVGIQWLARHAKHRFAATASPVVNCHRDLVNQLDIVDRLGRFGGTMSFLRTYCYGGQVRIGRGRMATDWSGSINQEELKARLDDGIWLRRPKELLLPELPAVQRVKIPTALSNRPTYDRIEKDLRSHLVEARLLQPGASIEEVRQKVAQLLRQRGVAALVQLGAYRKAGGDGKVKAAVAWVNDFLDSGESLVVFVWHQDVGRAILDAFPGSVGIAGGDTPAQRSEAVAAFQAGHAKLAVCSLGAGAEGITLTRASVCLTVELPWTESALVQAEGRVARIGQQAGRIVHYLLEAEDSLDQSMLDLLDEKAQVMAGIGLA